MAKDKDDSDLSPTAMAGEDDGLKDNSPQSFSDPNTPNTLSTEGQTKTQPQSDDESSSSPEASTTMSTKDKNKTSTALFTEQDLATLHPDVDLNDRNNLTRLIALLQNGWVLSRGHGPRDHHTCLWCRGPMEANTEILTHVGTSNSCRNSWPATCIMDWINQELDHVRGYKLDCPICREQFCNLTNKSGVDFKANQGKEDLEGVINAAWLRCVLFSPIFARQFGVEKGKPLIFITGAEAKKLVFLGKEKVIFYQCEGLLDPDDQENKRKWLKKQYGDNLPYTVEQMQQMGISLQEATAIAFAAATASPNPRADHEPLQLLPAFDTTWVVIDRGNNEFLMSPFLVEQANAVIRIPVELAGGTIKNMTAEEFGALAKENGGLQATIKGFKAGNEDDIKGARVLAEGWLHQMFVKNKQDGVPGPKFEFFKRVKDAHNVKLDFRLVGEEGAGDNDDDEEWEDDSDDST